MKRMNGSWYGSSRVYSMLILFFLLIVAPSSYCREDEYYSECAKPFNCGNLHNLSYPFWREGRSEICGYEGFHLQCRDGEFPVITIENQEFMVKDVNQSYKMMVIAPRVLWDNTCPANSTFNNITPNADLFSYTPDFSWMFENISLFYNCSNLESGVSPEQLFQCLVNGENRDAFYGYGGLEGGWRQEMSKCTVSVQVPVPRIVLTENGLNNLGDVLKEGFSIGYKYDENCERCRESRGICGTDIADSGFTCLCSDHSHPVSCSAGSRGVIVRKIIVAVGVVIALLACTFILLVIRKRQLFQSTRKNNDFEAFLEKHGRLAVKRYSYLQVKKMTNSFAEKLGQGGYGSVYKGNYWTVAL